MSMTTMTTTTVVAAAVMMMIMIMAYSGVAGRRGKVVATTKRATWSMTLASS